MAITRRIFFIATGLAAATAVVGGAVRLGTKPRHAYVKTIVRDRLPYLTFDDAVLDAFAEDFVTLTPAMSAARGEAIALPGMHFSRALGKIAGDAWAQRIEAFEQKVVSDFLKATDFFDSGKDTSKPLGYVAFPDPYLNTCRNPVAVIV